MATLAPPASNVIPFNLALEWAAAKPSTITSDQNKLWSYTDRDASSTFDSAKQWTLTFQKSTMFAYWKLIAILAVIIFILWILLYFFWIRRTPVPIQQEEIEYEGEEEEEDE